MSRFGSDLPRPVDVLDWPSGVVRFEDVTVRLAGFPFPCHAPDHAMLPTWSSSGRLPRPTDLSLTGYLAAGLDLEAKSRLLSQLNNHFGLYEYGKQIVDGLKPHEIIERKSAALRPSPACIGTVSGDSALPGCSLTPLAVRC
jgi:hypothetical protein